MIPRATYRLQFHRGFPFEAAFPLAPYFERLGISHVYSSPILKARPGSMHGYDLVDHSVINPELGGEDGFRKLARELRAHGIGLIVDIVPNHMAADEENGWWWDVLKHGRESRFGNFFDIDWDALDGKVLLAVLGKRYREALESAEIKVGLDERGAPCVRYFGRHWPLRPEDRNINANEYQSVERLHALLERQHYRLAWWRTANAAVFRCARPDCAKTGDEGGLRSQPCEDLRIVSRGFDRWCAGGSRRRARRSGRLLQGPA
jgi:(1->4)-alpha-D-glucan 1-alpha-D-glucosylmutase